MSKQVNPDNVNPHFQDPGYRLDYDQLQHVPSSFTPVQPCPACGHCPTCGRNAWMPPLGAWRGIVPPAFIPCSGPNGAVSLDA